MSSPPPPSPSPAVGHDSIACHDCDALFPSVNLQHGESLICPHCRAILSTRRRNSIPRATALAFSALLFYILANLFPFLELKAAGQVSSIVLAESVTALRDHGSPWLAGGVAIFILAAPLAITSGILYLLLPLHRDRRLPAAIGTARLVFGTDTWNMIEVFLLGVLVSLLKLSDIATVRLGLSFWAFAGLIICLTASLSVLDKRDLWDRLEGARP